MGISTNSEGEAAWYVMPCEAGRWSSQDAASQHGLLCFVKGDQAELLPVAHERLFLKDLVDCEFALRVHSLAERVMTKSERNFIHPVTAR